MPSPPVVSLALGDLKAPRFSDAQLQEIFSQAIAHEIRDVLSPTDRYVILDSDKKPRYSSNYVHAISLWFWGRCLAKNNEALRAHPWVVLDYERPIYVGCASVNCLGKRLGDPFFAQDALCVGCAQSAAPTPSLPGAPPR